jgi:hypothetical protein
MRGAETGVSTELGARSSSARSEEFPVRTCKPLARHLLALDIYYEAHGGAQPSWHNKE